MKVLVVDDETDVKDLFLQRFRKEIKAGLITTVFAHSASDAMDMLIERVPTDVMLILSDINMPGKSGINLLKDIRNADWPGKVIMLTNSSETFYRQRCLHLGASFFLDKTADFEKVPLILNGIL